MDEATANEHPLEPIFHPRSIAIVGVSRDGPGRRRSGFLQSLMEHGYHESKPLYPVNPNADTIAGLRAYPSIRDIEGPVDHVISSVPASVAPSLVDDAIAKGVRSIHFYTAGFAEIGDPELARQQRDIIGRATAAGIRVLGPNCMGLYVPSERISFQGEFPTEPGNVMVISQSGGNSMDIVHGLAKRGVRFSGAVSFGNGEDVDAADLFDYAASDPASEYVVAYLESSARGRQTFEALQRCARVKPTIVLKGGMTGAGGRAASSHTGALAGSREVFEAMCRQTGAMLAETMEELHDLLIGVTTNTRLVRGNHALMLGGGGGFSVLAADAIARSGLDLPLLDDETTARLRELMPVAGNSIRNPIDASHFQTSDDRADAYHKLLEIGAHAQGLDMMLVMSGGPPDFAPRPLAEQEDPDYARERDERRRAADRRSIEQLIELQESSHHPVVAVRREWGGLPSLADDTLAEAYAHGLGVFATVPRAARTIARLLEWRRQREGLPELF